MFFCQDGTASHAKHLLSGNFWGSKTQKVQKTEGFLVCFCQDGTASHAKHDFTAPPLKKSWKT